MKGHSRKIILTAAWKRMEGEQDGTGATDQEAGGSKSPPASCPPPEKRASGKMGSSRTPDFGMACGWNTGYPLQTPLGLAVVM